MTPRRMEAAVREAAVRAFGLPADAVPFVWPRNDHADGGADAATALPPRLVAAVADRLPPPRGGHRGEVAARLARQLSDMRDEGRVDFARVRADGRGFLNLTFTDQQREALLEEAADGPRHLTGRAWGGEGEWPLTALHEAGPVAQARRYARADARARIALALGAKAPPPGPEGESFWRDPYRDGERPELLTPAARALGAVGEDSARVAFCRSAPEHPRDSETTGRGLPVLPSAENPGAWARLTEANPAFHMRYVHAHAVSVLRWAEEGAFPHAACPAHTAPALGLLFDGPSALDTAARREEPHILVRYLEALASAYDEWRTCAEWRTCSAAASATSAALPAAVAGVLRTGLFLLGVSAPTRL
ncbi:MULTISPECIES: DALR anticodon-binding domain-containing protein [unclassified Nocardiopsis]|uniref:DALR anticodon-binding domain-containing protein n=1 Tax=unclassified Nocardiopsis TaxID=2649073 RepID=UPI00135B6DE0|nr:MULTISPECIES: DALR anticodon-binding domain-containing protein [unclassified Nocardiopsis]